MVTNRANGGVVSGAGGPTLLKKALLINVEYDTLNSIVTFLNYIDRHVFITYYRPTDLIWSEELKQMK